MANMKPPKALYNVVQVQQNTKMCKILKCKEWYFISVCLQKMIKNDVNKDQKRHKVNTIDSTTHDKSPKIVKSILGPKN